MRIKTIIALAHHVKRLHVEIDIWHRCSKTIVVHLKLFAINIALKQKLFLLNEIIEN